MNDYSKMINVKHITKKSSQIDKYFNTNSVIIFFDNPFSEKERFLFFIMEEEKKTTKIKPTILGYSHGSCGTMRSRNGDFEFLNDSSLQDSLSNQFGLYITQELEHCKDGEIEHLNHMIIAFANFLIKKYMDKQFFKFQSRSGLDKYQIEKIELFITRNLDNDISIKDLAGLLQLSVSHFIRAFKSTTSITPYQYLLKCKMEKAKQQLVKSNSSIIQAALESGFENPSHFAQVFKNQYGLTPTQYRKQNEQINCLQKTNNMSMTYATA